MPAADPRADYARRLEARRATVREHEQLDLRVAQARLGAILLVGAAIWFSWGANGVSSWWIAPPVAMFLVLIVVHERVIQAKRRAMRAVAFYENGLARIDDRWIGRGQSTELFADETHLYAADLDLFGKGSLFELLCTARTRSGEETLARWLASPAGSDEIRRRQAAVAELRDRVDLREDLAILGPDIRSSIHPDTMARWGGMPPLLSSSAVRVAAHAIAAVVTVTAIAVWFPDANHWWGRGFVGGMLVESGFALLLRSRVQQVLVAVEGPKRDLELLSLLLARIEREDVNTELLVDLRARLITDGLPPSRYIARLVRLVDLLTAKRADVIVASGLYLALKLIWLPFSFLLWSTHIAFAVENWRHTCGPRISAWLTAIGELEALCALAAYLYEHPADPFPEIADAAPVQPGVPREPAVFDGEALAHPLMPAGASVPNDVQLGPDRQLMVISGSNMSGKSTLLRTVGVNTVLALAGAPVRARRLRVTPVAIGATLRIQDSLQTGTSRFYAEIQRIRHVMDLTSSDRPVLFLLDEVLHGTNSHDRAVGAEAIVRGLIDRSAIGLVTTHDLALAAVADSLAPRAINVHFSDDLKDGKMHFDYHLHPGVVTKSNALALMRAVGLDVS